MRRCRFSAGGAASAVPRGHHRRGAVRSNFATKSLTFDPKAPRSHQQHTINGVQFTNGSDFSAKSSAQNAYMVSCLLAIAASSTSRRRSSCNCCRRCSLLPRGGVQRHPPYDLWEHLPQLGKLPEHGSDVGSYLVGEVFGARTVTFLKDVDGLYTARPEDELRRAVHSGDLRRGADVAEPCDPAGRACAARADFPRETRQGRAHRQRTGAGNLTRALRGELVGTLIDA